MAVCRNRSTNIAPEDPILVRVWGFAYCKGMPPDIPPSTKGRGRRVRKNLRQGMGLAWTASPSSLIRYSILGMLSAAMPPIAVYLGASLVNRIAEARLHSLRFTDLV